MAKIRITQPIQSLGLIPRAAVGLEYKANTPNVTVSLILKGFMITHKEDSGDNNDSIRVFYIKRYLDADGQQMGEKSEVTRDWHITDEGAVWEYDTYEWNLFDQADIDDLLNTVVMNVDGIHIDRIFVTATGEDVDPIESAGEPDLTTGIEITPEKAPLTTWMTNWGTDILDFIAPLILAREGY